MNPRRENLGILFAQSDIYKMAKLPKRQSKKPTMIVALRSNRLG